MILSSSIINSLNKTERFSDLVKGKSYEEEVNKIKELKLNSQENDYTSISHIVEDVNFDSKIGDIYNEMSQIFKNSIFYFAVEGDKISVGYKNGKNKKYEELLKDMETFINKTSELIDNYNKLKQFLEKVKKKIQDVKINNFDIELELYENNENSNYNYKNIDCIIIFLKKN